MSTFSSSSHATSLAAGLVRADSLSDTVSARVSSGRRIDRPAVDSAGLGQAMKLDSEQVRLRAAEVNIQNGVSRLQVTGGQLNALSRFATRLSELATLGANPVQNSSERALYAEEFKQIQSQMRQVIGGGVTEIGGTADIDRPSGAFNGRPLFGPGPGDSLVVGSGAEERLTLPVINLREGAVGDLIKQDASGAFLIDFSATSAADLGPTIRAAIDQIANAQADVGSGESRLNLASTVVSTAALNHESAVSVIMDADLATENTELARLKMLTESHTAMLAQSRDASAKLITLLSRK